MMCAFHIGWKAIRKLKENIQNATMQKKTDQLTYLTGFVVLVLHIYTVFPAIRLKHHLTTIFLLPHEEKISYSPEK